MPLCYDWPIIFKIYSLSSVTVSRKCAPCKFKLHTDLNYNIISNFERVNVRSQRGDTTNMVENLTEFHLVVIPCRNSNSKGHYIKVSEKNPFI